MNIIMNHNNSFKLKLHIAIMDNQQEGKKEPVYCKDCTRWYSTQVDQCELPHTKKREYSSELIQRIVSIFLELKLSAGFFLLKANMVNQQD